MEFFKAETPYMKGKICTDTTQTVKCESSNQRRHKIRQIDVSIDDIVTHAFHGEITVYPTSKNHTDLHQRLTELSSCGLAYVSDNLSVSANINTQYRTDNILYDVFYILDDNAAAVLSVTKDCVNDKELEVRYNTSLARGIVQAVRNFTVESFSVVFGLISESELTSQESFNRKLQDIITKTSRTCVPDSLSMVGEKYKRLIRAFLSSVALTSSVVNDDNSNTLWFLTLEQFCILTENIDQRQVTVRTAPSSGGKLLMREVAKRLERSGPTLLVMESEQQIQVARNLKNCSFMKTGEEWRDMQDKGEHIEGLTNLVTNCQDCRTVPGIAGKTWTFLSVPKPQTLVIDDKQTTQEETGEAMASVNASNDPSVLLRRNEELGRSKAEEINQLEMRIRELQEVKRQHENDLINKDSEIMQMREEIKTAKQTEEELNRLLDSASLSGLSLDSGFLSDTRSMVSWSSASTSASSLGLDIQGPTGGQVKSKSRLRNLLKRLPGQKKVADKGIQMPPEVAEKSAAVSSVQLLPRDTIHILTDENNKMPLLLVCEQHEMDRERVNTEFCHVTEDGQLVNSPPTSRVQQESLRFKTYRGTCSTSPIPLFTSSLIPVLPSPQYWETEATVGMKGRLTLRRWSIVLEVGLVEEDQLDSRWRVHNRPRSWCVMVVWCDTHNRYCTQLWNQDERIKCVFDPLSDTPYASHTLRYGVVIDTVRGRLGFVDVDRGVVLEKINIEIGQTVYPVFGVNPRPDWFTLQMRLVSGSDIQMTDDKQKLIYSCLT